MMLLDLSVSVTLILSLGIALLAGAWRLPAAAKHLLCLAALSTVVLLPVFGYLPKASERVLFHVSANPSSEPMTSSPGAIDWLAGIWILGSGAVVLRFLLGLGYLAWQTRRASIAAVGPADARVEIRIANVATPLVWGWRRPTILVPMTFPELSAEHRKVAIEHEMAHVDRRDCWTSLISLAAQAMYWFHPLVWLLSKKLIEQRERAADDRVLALGTDAAGYAEMLVSTARGMRSQFLFGCGMLGSANTLKGRIEYLLRPQRPLEGIRTRATAWCGAALLLSLALVLPVGAGIAETVYKTGGDVTAPQLVHKIEPNYTRKARREKKQGIVLLNVVINGRGKAESVSVERRLTPDLDLQAIRAVSRWRFKPATRQGHPVAVKAQVEVQFRLL